jgi:signal transduction histidine kinase
MAMLTFTDITERKEAEEAIMTANEEANLYLDIMVHDINNVNTVALGYSDILSEDLEGKDREMAQKIRSSVRQSIEIIQNVSTIRRLRPPNPVLKPVDLDTVIRAELRQHPETTIRYSGTSVDVRADDLLSEVFTNLLGNSIKFGEPDVVVTIRVEEQDGEVLVSVEDTGPGIPDAIKPTLFSRFRKGKSSRSGKGLGLYIVRMLVERYGGSVRVEDRVPGRPEEGAAFRFTLIKAQEE